MIQRWSLIAYALRERAQGEWVRWEDVRPAIEALAELGAASLAFDEAVTAASGRRYRAALDAAQEVGERMVTRAEPGTGGAT